MIKYLFLIAMLLMLVIKVPIWVNTWTIVLCSLLAICLLQDLIIKPLWRKRQRRLTAETNAQALKGVLKNE